MTSDRKLQLILLVIVTIATFFVAFDKHTSNMQSTGPTQFYAHFRTENGSLVHVITTDTTQTWHARPVLHEQTATTSKTSKEEKAVAGVNGGYFNLKGGESASYVVIDGNTVADPKDNDALVNNPELKPYLEQIFNRSELRVLSDNGQIKYAICNHNDEVAGGQLLHSLQAGPRLLPSPAAEEEAFVRTDSNGNEIDSIGAKRNAARTAVGIRPDGTLLLVCVAGKQQDSSSPGLTLQALSNLLKELGCTQGLNLDGGTSTTMYVHPKSDSYGVVACATKPEKLVKSVLLIKLNDTLSIASPKRFVKPLVLTFAKSTQLMKVEGDKETPAPKTIHVKQWQEVHFLHNKNHADFKVDRKAANDLFLHYNGEEVRGEDTIEKYEAFNYGTTFYLHVDVTGDKQKVHKAIPFEVEPDSP